MHCPAYYCRFYTGQETKITDSRVKIRTPSNPNYHQQRSFPRLIGLNLGVEVVI